jgi:hypothetical protein
LFHRFALRLSRLRETVEGIEWPRFTGFQEDSQSRHPVGALPGDQVADNVECAPCIFSFIGVRPEVGLTAQQRIQGCGGAGEEGDGLGWVEFRRACHAYIDTCLAVWTQATLSRVEALLYGKRGLKSSSRISLV